MAILVGFMRPPFVLENASIVALFEWGRFSRGWAWSWTAARTLLGSATSRRCNIIQGVLSLSLSLSYHSLPLGFRRWKGITIFLLSTFIGLAVLQVAGRETLLKPR